MIENEKRTEKLKEKEYQEKFGVNKSAFDKMKEIPERAYKELHILGGRSPRLSVPDKLVVTTGYYRDCRTTESIAFDCDVSKSRISDAVKWVENTLIADGTFSSPSKREQIKADTETVIAIIDVKEQETERPKKNRKNHTRESKNVTQQKIWR